ncbi:MAG: hypothetical protein EBR28_01820 [Planctomycetia bacterium]|nr:hypothetical protein [Planctomycetia bacterium]
MKSRSPSSPWTAFLIVAVCVHAAFEGGAVSVAADAAPSAAGQASNPAESNPADRIVGDWRPSDMPDVGIRIFPSKGKYIGGVVKAANPAMVNTEMLREIEYVPETRSWKGEVFAMKRGMFVPMTIRLTTGGLEMVAGVGIMSKTITWVPLEAVPAPRP